LRAARSPGYHGNRLPFLRRVLVLYNTDYDAELIAAVDVSAVRVSAEAVAGAVATAGYDCELMGLHGADLGMLLARLASDPPDLVFNLCESLNGDARNELVVPAVLDMLGVRYTGTGALGIGLCLHKDRAGAILRAQGVPTPASRLVRHASDLEAPLDVLGYPCFLKLVHEDASVGIDARNHVADARALALRAGELLAQYRQPVLVERFIDGREVNVTLLGNPPALEVLPLHEIDFGAMPPERPRIVSYAAKWDERHEEYAGTRPVPMPADPALEARVEDAARRAFAALGVRDFGRVDMRVDASGQPWVIDVNPNCDLSPDAGVARAAAQAGLAYPALIGRICEIAWSRHEDPSGHGG
jgi:D-alanine-D-alanine ligase